jgi:hypothetical protein
MIEQDDGYSRWATQQSKWAVSAFSITCLFIIFVKDWGFGFWWIAVWSIGIFAVSAAAAPFSIGEWFARKKGFNWLALLLGICHTWGVFPAAFYGLKLLNREFF